MKTETKIPGAIRVNDDGSEEMVREYGNWVVVLPGTSEETMKAVLLDNFEWVARNENPLLLGRTPELICHEPLVGENVKWAWYVCDWFPR